MVPCLCTSVLSKLGWLPYPLYQAKGAEDPVQGLAHRWKVLASVIECLKDWEISEFILEDLGILRIGVWGPLCECCKGKGIRWSWRGKSGSDYERLWAATMLERQDSILKAHILKSGPPPKKVCPRYWWTPLGIASNSVICKHLQMHMFLERIVA